MRKLVLFAVVSVLSVACFGQASAQQVYWKTRSLTWTTGGLTKSFTASVADTGFLMLPDDIAWDVMGSSAQAQSIARLSFYTPTAAANADTVPYTVQVPFYVGSTAVYPFSDYRNQTAAASNSAVRRDLGLVFHGSLQFNGTGITTSLPFAHGKGSRVKVQGDPNGALASLRAQITYPSYISN